MIFVFAPGTDWLSEKDAKVGEWFSDEFRRDRRRLRIAEETPTASGGQ